LGLGSVFQAIFPVVGAIALGQVVFDLGEKLVDLRSNALAAGDAMRAAMEEAHVRAQVNIDDLDIQAEKLQMNIDKLSGKPNNGLSLALAEARKMADQLQVSLAADRKELEQLLKEHSVSNFASIISGVSATGSQEKEIDADHKALETRIAGINAQFSRDVSGAKSTDDIEAAGKRRDDAIRESIQQTIRVYQAESKRLGDEEEKSRKNAEYLSKTTTAGDIVAGTPRITDNSAKIANIQSVISRYQDFLATQQAQARVADLTKTNNAFIGAKTSRESASKSGDNQRKQWEDQFAAFTSGGDTTAADERKWWYERANSVTQGSDSYAFAIRKANDLLKRENIERRKQVEGIRKLNDQWQSEGLKQLQQAFNPGAEAQSKGIVDSNRTYRMLADAQRDMKYAIAEANIQIAEQTGRISANDAAVQRQVIDEMRSADQLQKLRTELAAVQEGPEADAQRNRINTEITAVQTRQSVQAVQDGAAVAATRWRDALMNANAEWVQDAGNSARLVVQLYGSSINGLNQNLSSLIVGGRSDFSGYFRGIGQQIGTIGLQKIEAPILGKLGIGKADGSDTNPFAVKIVGGDGIDQIAGGGALGKLLGDSSDDSSDGSGASGFLGKVGGFFGAVFGGARATGGPVTAGQAYLVGERGPEPFIPSTSGTVLPTASLGGGGEKHYYTIDARGATDPAAMEAAITRAISTARPGIIAQSVAATHEYSRRRPSNSR
jgi:hypothetical protein